MHPSLFEDFLRHDAPEYIRSDNGPKFIAEAMQGWLARFGIKPIRIYPASDPEHASTSAEILIRNQFAHLFGNPDEERSCLTVDGLIPKFTFSGIHPNILANSIFFNWTITTPTTFPFSS